MYIDPTTSLIASSGTTIVQGLVLLLFWFQDRRAGALAAWGAGLALAGTGFALMAGRGTISDWLSIYVANALYLCACGLLWQGVRVFDGKRVSILAVLAGAGVWGSALLLPEVRESVSLRSILVTSLSSFYCAIAAIEIWRGRSDRLTYRQPLFVMLALLAIVFAIRVRYVDVLPFPSGAAPAVSGFAIIFAALWIFGSSTILAFLALALVKEKFESERRSTSLVDPVTGALKRGAFMLHGGRVVARYAHERRPVCFLLAALHLPGEDADLHMRIFAERTQASLRPTDLLARMGRREFACVLSDMSHGEAIAMAEAIHQSALSHWSWSAEAGLTIGLASSTQVGHDLRALISAADAALEAARPNDAAIVLYHPSLDRRVGDAGGEGPLDNGRVIPFSDRNSATTP